jgi:hypothetical protein
MSSVIRRAPMWLAAVGATLGGLIGIVPTVVSLVAPRLAQL